MSCRTSWAENVRRALFYPVPSGGTYALFFRIVAASSGHRRLVTRTLAPTAAHREAEIRGIMRCVRFAIEQAGEVNLRLRRVRSSVVKPESNPRVGIPEVDAERRGVRRTVRKGCAFPSART